MSKMKKVVTFAGPITEEDETMEEKLCLEETENMEEKVTKTIEKPH